MLIAIPVLSLCIIILTAALLFLVLRKKDNASEKEALNRIENGMREDFSLSRTELQTNFQMLRRDLTENMATLVAQNEKKLETIRETVDEKLHQTLEQRLGQSFQLVSERLEQVYKGLGEMQHLATGVGDLKRVLTGVKTRGTWGEIQLGALLDQLLTPEQYAQNVHTRRNSRDHVEFAIKLPGRDSAIPNVWLPIDAKFPQEDYLRLMDARNSLNAEAVEKVTKDLDAKIRAEAKDIHDKYIDPPYTTDFGIMFLTTEGLYAEVLRIPELFQDLQSKYRVTITGPTTLAALLNSLQMGFRTLAVEKRSSDVWRLLGTIKTEFGKFGDLLAKTHKKMQEASNTIEDAARKSRTISRQLSKVEELPQQESLAIEEKHD
jgi:DNA recombination protein RmuC